MCCCDWRLDSELPDKPEYTKSFFVGIPAPAAAFLVLLPVVVLEVTGQLWLRNEQLVSVVLVTVGAGAVSTMPTFNGNTWKVPSQAILPFLALSYMIGGINVISTRAVYLALAGLYVASFPISLLAFYRRRRHFSPPNSRQIGQNIMHNRFKLKKKALLVVLSS